MDMLFQRYANPMPLIDKMLMTGRFREFVDEFINIRNEEVEEKTLWELWLHKIFDKDFNEFRNSLNIGKESEPTEDDLIATVTGSVGILHGFNLSE